MNSDLNRWLVNSVYKHFRENLKPDYCYIQGEIRPKDEPVVRYEFRMIGPDWTENGSEYIISLTVNLVIRSDIRATGPNQHTLRVGKALPVFSCIPINRYGHIPTDDQSRVGVLQRGAKLDTTHFDVIDPVANITLSTLEAEYVAHIRKGSL